MLSRFLKNLIPIFIFGCFSIAFAGQKGSVPIRREFLNLCEPDKPTQPTSRTKGFDGARAKYHVSNREHNSRSDEFRREAIINTKIINDKDFAKLVAVKYRKNLRRKGLSDNERYKLASRLDWIERQLPKKS
ncbi:hypothetical protein HOD08_01020 [bacterium]|nr:hypothetical protein [bacterium]